MSEDNKPKPSERRYNRLPNFALGQDDRHYLIKNIIFFPIIS